MDLPLKAVPIIAAAAIHHVKLRALRWVDVLACFILLAVPPHSVSCLLRPLSMLASSWPKLLGKSILSKLPDWLVGAKGPFGPGCFKVCEVLCAYLLLSAQHGARLLWPPPKAMCLGPTPSTEAIFCVLIMSAAVNLVLIAWSKQGQSRGDHAGMNATAEVSIGRQLGVAEHIQLVLFALGNAICEELVSRGFFFHLFLTDGHLSKNSANLLQAAAFGVWHYHGVPSGMSGVFLTFIYGWLMGELMLHGNGLYLPILAHSIADYFIFTVVLRQESSHLQRG
mmetsp:Transcript_39567/g.80726  ORF Transcript_39567/g.80726 Transcript_39567/m.80726 type:complete len:281 (+) Transcript_39567:38-880(+)